MIKKLLIIVLLFGLSASVTWASLSGLITIKGVGGLGESVSGIISKFQMSSTFKREEPQKAYMWEDREGHTTISLEPPKDKTQPFDTMVLSRDIERYSSAKIVDSFSADVPKPQPREQKSTSTAKKICPYQR